MDEPDWAKIIRVMYRENPPTLSVESGGDEDAFTARWLAERTSLSKSDVDNTTQLLQSWGLVHKASISVEGEDFTSSKIKFTEDGFNVAHEQEIAKRDHNINQALVVLTVFLVLSQTAAFLPGSDWEKTAMGGIIFVGLLVVIWYLGLFDR